MKEILLGIGLFVWVSAVNSQIATPRPGIDFDDVHYYIGMPKNQAFASMSASKVYHLVQPKGDKDGSGWAVAEENGSEIGLLIFNQNDRLVQAIKTWEVPSETAYSLIHVVVGLLNHLRDEGFTQCTVFPENRPHSLDLADTEDIDINCGQKSARISALYFGDGGERREGHITIDEDANVAASSPNKAKRR